MIALLLSQGTQVCARKHHLRHSDFRRGQRLGKYDHLIIWTRPQRPTWMDEATYAQIPATLVLREIRYNIVEPGRRTRSIDVITTLVDVDEFSTEEIAQLYGFRWNSELDIRSLKDSLHLGHVRCKSPEMVGREFWTTFLGYNLLRSIQDDNTYWQVIPIHDRDVTLEQTPQQRTQQCGLARFFAGVRTISRVQHTSGCQQGDSVFQSAILAGTR